MVAHRRPRSGANVQPMSCTDGVPSVEREIELPARRRDEVWDALPSLLGDDVELAAEPGGRFRARRPGGRAGRRGRGGRRAAPARVLVGAGRRRRRRRRSSRSSSTGGSAGRARCCASARRASTRPSCVDGLLRGPLARARAPDRVFAALADPTRCRVVERLGLAPATAGRSRRSCRCRARRS